MPFPGLGVQPYCSQCMQHFSDTQTKMCLKCDRVLPFREYSSSSHDRFKIQSNCRECHDAMKRAAKRTVRGFLAGLLASARQNSKKRLSKGREESGLFLLTIADLLAKWKQQNGRCYYSKVPLTTRPLTDWMCSLERLNPAQGYTAENTVLICWEFNHSQQWTREKLRVLYSLSRVTHSAKEKADFYAPVKRTVINPRCKSVLQEMWTRGVSLCLHCGTEKALNDFYGHKRSCCRECSKKRMATYTQRPRHHLLSLLRRAKQHCNDWARNTNRKGTTDLNLCFDDLVEKYLQQRGRCYYSNAPLAFGLNTEWGCSLERLDPCKGYVKDNVVLIVKELNMFDHTADCKNVSEGSGSWSKDKIALVFTMCSLQSHDGN